MSKDLQVTVYVDENVSSIASAREYAKRAEHCIEEAKRKLWGMVTSTYTVTCKSLLMFQNVLM